MMEKNNNSRRREFLKKIPIAIVSLGTFSVFKLKKPERYFEKKFHTLSKSEADEIIKDDKFTVSTQVEPAPAPVAQKNIKG